MDANAEKIEQDRALFTLAIEHAIYNREPGAADAVLSFAYRIER